MLPWLNKGLRTAGILPNRSPASSAETWEPFRVRQHDWEWIFEGNSAAWKNQEFEGLEFDLFKIAQMLLIFL
jgi:hypothetical protein